MPLKGKDVKILQKMKKHYGADKGEDVFYASATKGTLGEGVKKRHGSKKGKR
jgi:hypothetical protein